MSVNQTKRRATDKSRRQQRRQKSRLHEEKRTDNPKKEKMRKHKKPRRRLFPIWLRLIVFLVLSICIVVCGLMIGFSVLGDGNAKDVLDKATWQHIIDIVIKEQ